MWKTGIRPKTLPSSLGTSRVNSITRLLPHKRRTVVAAPRSVPARPRRLCFLFAEKFRTSGSTIMRGQQLSDLVRERFSDEFDVSITLEHDVRDAIVVITKGALATLKADDLHALRRKNIAVVGDYVDDPPSRRKAVLMDLLLAASIEGFVEVSRKFPNVRSEYLPHHVDPRITPGVAPKNVFAVGYFGEPKNAVRYEAIESLVDFIDVNTRTSDTEWMQRLAGYSLHYAARPLSQKDGAKPFLKGFTAAHCGANVIVTADDGDASYYLGDDYPYLLRSRSEADIRGDASFREGVISRYRVAAWAGSNGSRPQSQLGLSRRAGVPANHEIIRIGA